MVLFFSFFFCFPCLRKFINIISSFLHNLIYTLVNGQFSYTELSFVVSLRMNGVNFCSSSTLSLCVADSCLKFLNYS